MCACHGKAPISTDFPFTLWPNHSAEKRSPFRWSLVAQLAVAGPLIVSVPYVLIGAFFAPIVGFILGVVPALLGGMLFVFVIDRVTNPKLGTGLVIGALSGVVGCFAAVYIYVCLIALIEGKYEDPSGFLSFAGYLALHGGVAGALLGSIEGRNLERAAKARAEKMKPLE